MSKRFVLRFLVIFGENKVYTNKYFENFLLQTFKNSYFFFLSCLILIVIFSPSSFALESEEIDAVDYFSISCNIPEDQNVHRFQAIGFISVAKNGDVRGSISLQLIKGTEIRSIMQINESDVMGSFETFEPTETQPNGFQVLTLYVSNPYVRVINLIFKEASLASSVLSIDNFSYRSDCKIIR